MPRTENKCPRIVRAQRIASRRRILLVHSSVQLRRKLVDELTHAGYELFQARGRADGLPLLYQVRPELILLEVSEAADETLEIFSRIRILTDIPVILLAQFKADPVFQSLADQNAQVLVPPLAVAKVIRAVKATLRFSVSPSPQDAAVPEEHPVSFRSDGFNLDQQLAWLHALLSRIRTVQTEMQFIMAAAQTLALAMDNGYLIQRAREAAITDDVTGLYSPAYADRILASEKARMERYGRGFAVVQLNWVNGQRYREAWGDRSYAHTLRQIADMCKKQVRASDVVARCADVSFELVLPETNSLQAQNVASRLGQAIQARFVDYEPEARPEVIIQVTAG